MVKIKKTKNKIFWFHYNKPLSKKHGKNILTVHYNKTCYFVENIECSVPIKTKHNKTQPHCVLKGSCQNFAVQDNVCYIW